MSFYLDTATYASHYSTFDIFGSYIYQAGIESNNIKMQLHSTFDMLNSKTMFHAYSPFTDSGGVNIELPITDLAQSWSSSN